MLLVGFAHWGIRFWGYRFFRLQMNPGYMNRIPANECQDSVYSCKIHLRYPASARVPKRLFLVPFQQDFVNQSSLSVAYFKLQPVAARLPVYHRIVCIDHHRETHL